MRVARIGALFAILLSAAAAGVFSQAAVPAAPTVLLLADPGEGSDGANVAEIVSGAVRLELERAGLRAIPGAAPASREGAAALSPPDAARAAGADFALLVRTAVAGREVVAGLVWYDAAAGRRGAEAGVKGKVDLNLDRIVSEAVRGMLAREADAVAGAKAVAAAAVPPASAPAAAGAAAGGPGGSGGAGRPPASGVPEAPAGPVDHFEFSAGSSLFLFVGAASGYTRMGTFPSFGGAWTVRLPSSLLEIGLSAGANLFEAEGGLAVARGLLAPAGLDLRYVGVPAHRLSPFLRLGGGPALLGMNPNGDGMMFKVVPYVLGGVGVYLRLFGRTGLVLDSTYTVFFDGPTLVMGYAPGLYFFARL